MTSAACWLLLVRPCICLQRRRYPRPAPSVGQCKRRRQTLRHLFFVTRLTWTSGTFHIIEYAAVKGMAIHGSKEAPTRGQVRRDRAIRLRHTEAGPIATPLTTDRSRTISCAPDHLSVHSSVLCNSLRSVPHIGNLRQAARRTPCLTQQSRTSAGL